MKTHDANALPRAVRVQRPIPALQQEALITERLRSRSQSQSRQRGVAAVEFALIALIFFTLLFAILEFGRMLYLYNTMQEVTRRGAREAVVRWIDPSDRAEIKKLALFGGAALPAGPEITTGNISIGYLNQAGNQVSAFPEDPGDNIAACLDATRSASCIASVRVAIDDVRYSPMVALFGFLDIALPASVVIMRAESLGLYRQ